MRNAASLPNLLDSASVYDVTSKSVTAHLLRRRILRRARPYSTSQSSYRVLSPAQLANPPVIGVDPFQPERSILNERGAMSTGITCDAPKLQKVILKTRAPHQTNRR